MNEMEREWFDLVNCAIAQHPSLVPITIMAIQSGIKTRLEKEQEARANAEASLIVAFQAAGGIKAIPQQHRDMVKEAVKHTRAFAGTQFAEDL